MFPRAAVDSGEGWLFSDDRWNDGYDLCRDRVLAAARRGFEKALFQPPDPHRAVDLVADQVGDVEGVDRALPIGGDMRTMHRDLRLEQRIGELVQQRGAVLRIDLDHREARSEEHTSELQSLMRISYAVFCLN